MLVSNQLIEMKWNGRTKEHYESLGYKYTRSGETFYVKAEDLSKGSPKVVKVQCINCDNTYDKQFSEYARVQRFSKEHLCKDCTKYRKAHLMPKFYKKIKGFNIKDVYKECLKYEKKGYDYAYPITKKDIVNTYMVNGKQVRENKGVLYHTKMVRV